MMTIRCENMSNRRKRDQIGLKSTPRNPSISRNRAQAKTSVKSKLLITTFKKLRRRVELPFRHASPPPRLLHLRWNAGSGLAPRGGTEGLQS